jgi:hypothetical protein
LIDFYGFGSELIRFIFGIKRGIMAGETGQDDQIIELTEVVDDEANMVDASSDDDIIELMDLESETGDMADSAMLPDDAMGDDVPGDDVPGDDVPGDDVPGEEVPGEEVPGEEVPGEDTPGEEVLQAVAAISPQQVEAALERVIEKQFADKIEPLLFDTMERVILSEIKKIKKTLLKDMDQIGPF